MPGVFSLLHVPGIEGTASLGGNERASGLQKTLIRLPGERISATLPGRLGRMTRQDESEDVCLTRTEPSARRRGT